MIKTKLSKVLLLLILLPCISYAQTSPKLILSGHKEGVNICAFSPDGKTMISGSKDGVLKTWDVTAMYAPLRELVTGDDAITALAYSHSGDRIAVGTLNTLFVYDSKSFKRLARNKKAHVTFITSAAFSPDDKLIVSASWKENALMIWESSCLKKENQLGEGIWTDEAFFSPDGNTIISCNHDNVAKAWDVKTGNILKTFAGHSDWIYSVKLSPDMKTLITGSFDKTIKIWDYQQSKLLHTLEGHKEGISTLALSPDNRFIASASVDGNILLWDLSTQKQVAVLAEKGASVLHLEFANDSKSLVSCSVNHTMSIWDVSGFPQ